MTKLKSIFNWFLIFIFTLAMAVNVFVASKNVLDMFFTKNELIYAGNFLNEIKDRVDSQGAVILETNRYKIVVATNEYFDKQKGETND